MRNTKCTIVRKLCNRSINIIHTSSTLKPDAVHRWRYMALTCRHVRRCLDLWRDCLAGGVRWFARAPPPRRCPSVSWCRAARAPAVACRCSVAAPTAGCGTTATHIHTQSVTDRAGALLTHSPLLTTTTSLTAEALLTAAKLLILVCYWQQHVTDTNTLLTATCYWQHQTVINVAGSSKYEWQLKR